MGKKGTRRFSSFAKAAFERDVLVSNRDDVEYVLKQIHSIETNKFKNDIPKEVPKYIQRLVKGEADTQTVRSRYKNSCHQKVYRKAPEIREVKKRQTSLDVGPSSSHYNPNYNSILTSSPAISMSSNKPKKSQISADPSTHTMNEMMKKWIKDIRKVEFIKEQPSVQQLELPMSPVPTTFASKKGYKFSNSKDERDSFIILENTPGPSAYNVQRTPLEKGVIAFDKQAPRPDFVQNDGHNYRDTRSNLDAVRPRTPAPIPFDKQSSREKTKKEEDDIWKQIAEEQAEIIRKITNKPEKVEPKKKTIQPFSQQTSHPKISPFEHIMRREINVEYNPEKSLEYLERPKTAFNISQPAFHNKREILVKTDAPDKFYDNVTEQFKNTINRPPSPPPMARMNDRKSPYNNRPS